MPQSRDHDTRHLTETMSATDEMGKEPSQITMGGEGRKLGKRIDY